MNLSPRTKAIAAALVALWIAASPGRACEEGEKKSLEVTVSAYNSIPSQTSGNAAETAWGDKLKPGMKAVAVSQDLIKRGLGHKTPVRIEGLKGEYLVLDKMPKRWAKRVDVYMGKDVKAARKWGKKKRTITWCAP
jgi:3D (Asp-Asp-Asp) domain-containing protein